MLFRSFQEAPELREALLSAAGGGALRLVAGGGGEKKKPMPKDATDFDVVLVGGANCAALLKFLQKNDDAQKLRMAIVSPDAVWVQPQCYFGVTHRFISTLKLQTGALAGQCDGFLRCQLEPGFVAEYGVTERCSFNASRAEPCSDAVNTAA